MSIAKKVVGHFSCVIILMTSLVCGSGENGVISTLILSRSVKTKLPFKYVFFMYLIKIDSDLLTEVRLVCAGIIVLAWFSLHELPS